MTKKDFSMIACILKSHEEMLSFDDYSDLVTDFIVALKLENPRFDEIKFSKACFGVLV